MKTVRSLFGKVGFTAAGVGVGIILAAGSGFAAVQLSRNSASDHSIDAIQATSPSNFLVDREKSSVSVADDRVGPDDRMGAPGTDDTSGTDDRSGTASPEPEPNDDRTSKPNSTPSSSGGSGHHDSPAPRSPEPGDDHGGKGGNH
jgi:hypothetical protein